MEQEFNESVSEFFKQSRQQYCYMANLTLSIQIQSADVYYMRLKAVFIQSEAVAKASRTRDYSNKPSETGNPCTWCVSYTRYLAHGNRNRVKYCNNQYLKKLSWIRLHLSLAKQIYQECVAIELRVSSDASNTCAVVVHVPLSYHTRQWDGQPALTRLPLAACVLSLGSVHRVKSVDSLVCTLHKTMLFILLLLLF